MPRRNKNPPNGSKRTKKPSKSRIKKDLMSPKYRQRIVEDKRGKHGKNKKEIDFEVKEDYNSLEED